MAICTIINSSTYCRKFANETDDEQAGHLIGKVAKRLVKHYPSGRGSLFIIYFVMKTFTVGILIGNVYFIFAILFGRDLYYAPNVVWALVQGNASSQVVSSNGSIFYPIMYCKVFLEQLGSRNSLLAQCALPLNVAFEKVYSILFLMLFLAIAVTLLDMFTWLVWLCGKQFWLRVHLRRRLFPAADFSRLVNVDVYFVLLMLSRETDNIWMTQLVRHLHAACTCIDGDDMYVQLTAI